MKNLGKNQTKIIAVLGLVVLACAVSFMGGIYYQKGRPVNQTVSTGNQVGATAGPNGFGGMGGFRRGVVGQVTAVSASSISVKDSRTASTTTLTITANTVVSNSGSAASVTDIKVGDTVIVRPNRTDTTQAAQIILNPLTQPSSGSPSGPPAGSSVPTQTN